jgi:hypothetical protein
MAFYRNDYITSVSMPGVKTIGDDAFSNVYFLSEIFMPRIPPSRDPPSTEGNPFSGILTKGDFLIHVPAGTSIGASSDYHVWADTYFTGDDINVCFLADM